MENFEHLLKNGFSGDQPEQRFEFKEEYWLQAQQLLEQAEQDARRRAVALRLLFGLLLLLFFGAGYGWYAYSHSAKSATPSTPPEHLMPQSAAAQPMAQVPNEQQAAELPGQQTSATESASLAIAQPNAVQQGLGSSTLLLPSNTPKSNPSKPTEQQSKSYNTSVTSTTNSLPTSIDAASQQMAASHTSDGRTTGGTSENLPITSQRLDNTLATDSRLDSGSPNRDEIQNQAKPTLSADVASHQLPSLALLPTRTINNFASAPTVDKKPTFILSNEDKMDYLAFAKVQDKPIHVGAIATIATPTGLFFNEQLGLAVGLTANKRIGQRFSAHADLKWRRVAGNNGVTNSDKAEFFGGLDPSLLTPISNSDDKLGVEDISYTNYSQTNYDFGYQTSTVTVTPRALHYLELPISLRFHIRKFALEAGISTAFQVLDRYEVVETIDQSLADATTNKRQAYISKGDTDRFLWAPMAGLHWQPNQRWSLGLRSRWTMNRGVISARKYLADQNFANVPNGVRAEFTQQTQLTHELRLAHYF